MGLEPAINRVMRCSPRGIVGSNGAGEVVCSARAISALIRGEPAAATESPKRNSLRPIAGTAYIFDCLHATASSFIYAY